MKFLISFVLLGLSSSQILPVPAPTPVVLNCPTAAPTPIGRKSCGSSHPPQALLDRIPSYANRSAASSRQIPPVISIDTWFHVISTNASQNTYDDSFYFTQLQVMNDRYSNTNFQFNLVGFERDVNDTLAVSATDADVAEVKRKYHKGSYSTLNLYFLSDWRTNGKENYGRCTYPVPGVVRKPYGLVMRYWFDYTYSPWAKVRYNQAARLLSSGDML
jgi:hypothetical protein